jgi:hypothetical protein
MNADDKTKLSTWLFNPFIYVAGAKALLIGWAAILLAGFLGSLSKTHLDGVLDMHTGIAAPRWVFLAEGFVDWICLTATLLIAGRILSRTSFRTIDLAGTQALARWPTVLVGLIALPKGYQRFSAYLLEQFLKHGERIEFAGADAFVFAAVVLGMILLLCWMVFLMYRSYSVSCNLRGAKAVLSFIGALIVAEILSKAALYWFFNQA